ncbi:MAG TPA: tetratricopeptide repeat protein [Acidisarcina sp.]
MTRKSHAIFLSRTCIFVLASLPALILPGLVYGQTEMPSGSKPASSAAVAPAAAQKVPDRATAYYHYALAHDYEEMATTYERADYATRAIEEYKLALNSDPTSKFLNNGLAELYFKTGRAKEAIAAAEELLKKDPANLDAHKLLGRIYLRSLSDSQSGVPSEPVLKLAISEYMQIVALEPDNTENRLLLGRLYTVAHDTPHAEEQFKAAQQIDPDSEEVALSLAEHYRENNELQRTVDLLQALPEDDQTTKTEFILGATYEQMKDRKKAIAAYRKAIELEPENLDAERALGQALLGDNQLSEALKAFQEVAAGNPEDASAYIRIAEIESHEGKYDEALATLKKAKALVKDSLEIPFNEALINDSLGRYDEAEQILLTLVTSSEHSSGQYSDEEKANRTTFLEHLATVYREENKIPQAIDAYQKMIALGGEEADRGYQGMVDTYRDAKDYAKATAVSREAVAKIPDDNSLKLMLAGQLADTGKADEGVALARSLLKGKADDRETELGLAQIYTRLHRWKEAEEEIDRAEKLSTRPEEQIYIHFVRGALYERQKQYEAAEGEFRKILAVDANNSMTLNYLGYMLADRGEKLPEALSLIQKAVQIEPQNYAYLDSLGWAYFKLGQYDKAEANLRSAMQRNSSEPTVHDHLGEVYEKTGRLKLAAAQWELSLQEYAHTVAADAEPADISKVEKKLETARVKLARQESGTATNKQQQ